MRPPVSQPAAGSSNPTNGSPPVFPNNGNNPVDDVFCARDANFDGVAESISRLATLATNFAEPTGLIFDPFVPNQLYVNVQHASTGSINQFGNFVPDGLTGNDLIVQFNVPAPAKLSLLGLGLAGLPGWYRRRAYHRLQPRQSAASAGLAGGDRGLVAHERATTAVQDWRAAHPARSRLHPTAG